MKGHANLAVYTHAKQSVALRRLSPGGGGQASNTGSSGSHDPKVRGQPAAAEPRRPPQRIARGQVR